MVTEIPRNLKIEIYNSLAYVGSHLENPVKLM